MINFPRRVKRSDFPQNTISLNTTGEITLLAAGGAGIFHDLTFLLVSSAASSEVRVDIRDTTGGTVRMPINFSADGGGAAPPMPLAGFLQTTANTNWTAQLSAATTGNVYITAQAIKRQ